MSLNPMQIECSGNGNCSADGLSCECGDDGWRGDQCEVPGCPGLLPNGNECTGHGSCITEGIDEDTGETIFVCACNLGWNGRLYCHCKLRCYVKQTASSCMNQNKKNAGEECLLKDFRL